MITYSFYRECDVHLKLILSIKIYIHFPSKCQLKIEFFKEITKTKNKKNLQWYNHRQYIIVCDIRK